MKRHIKSSIILRAINCAQNNIIITDIDANIIWCNNHTLIYTGYTSEELVCKNPSIFKHESTQLHIYKEMWDTIKTKKLPWKGKMKNKKKDGSTYYEELTITPILDKDNNIEYFVGVQNDITELEIMKENIKSKISQVQAVVKSNLEKR